MTGAELVPPADVLAAVEVELERPTSPWTPSYSVTTQGSVGTEPLPEQGSNTEQLSLPARRETGTVNDYPAVELPPTQIGSVDLPIDTEYKRLAHSQDHLQTEITMQMIDIVVSNSEVVQPEVRTFVMEF